MKISKKHLFAVAMTALFMGNTEMANGSSAPMTDISGHRWIECTDPMVFFNGTLYRSPHCKIQSNPSDMLKGSKLCLDHKAVLFGEAPFNAVILTMQHVKENSVTLTEIYIDEVALTQAEFDALCENIETNPNLKVVRLLDIPMNRIALAQLAEAIRVRSEMPYPSLDAVDISADPDSLSGLDSGKLSDEAVISFLSLPLKYLNVKNRLTHEALYGEFFRATQKHHCIFLNDGFEIDNTNPREPKLHIFDCNGGHGFGISLGDFEQIDVEMDHPSLKFIEDFGKGLKESLKEYNRECSGVSLTLSKRGHLEQEFIDCLGTLPIVALHIDGVDCIVNNLNWSAFLANKYLGKLHIQGYLNDNFYSILENNSSPNLETIIIKNDGHRRKIPAAWVINVFALHPNLSALIALGTANMDTAEKEALASWQANPSDEVAIQVGVLHIGDESF